MSYNPHDELKKALHRALMTAYKNGNKVVRKAMDPTGSDAVSAIVSDLKDPNSNAEVNPNELPPTKESVLNKDKKEPNAIAQAYDISQDQKKAALNMQTNPHPQAKEPKKLQSFMQGKAAKMEKSGWKETSHKASHPAIQAMYDKEDAKKQAASEAHLKSPKGEAERQARNSKMMAEQKKLGKSQAVVRKPTSIPHPQQPPKEASIPVAKPQPKPMTKSHGIAAARHGVKAAHMKLKHESEKARLDSQKPMKTSMNKSAQKGVHQPYLAAQHKHTGKASMGTSEAGFRAKLGSKLNSRRDYDGNVLKDSPSKEKNKRVAIDSAKAKHQQVIGELKAMPKPNLGKSQKHPHRPKIKVLDSKEPFGTTDKFHYTGKNAPMGQVARKQNLKDLKKQPPKPLGKDEDMGMEAPMMMSLNSKKKVLNKAKIDQNLPQKEKQYQRYKRAGDHTAGVHTAPFKSAKGMSNAGYGLDIGDKSLARENHYKVRAEQKTMSKPNLGKSNLNKGIDENGKPIKGSNKSHQQKKLFGESGEPSPDKKSDKKFYENQKSALNRLAQKRYGMPIVESKGKMYELARINKDRIKNKMPKMSEQAMRESGDFEFNNPKASTDTVRARYVDQKSNPKPDWRSGNLEAQRHIGAQSHELGHLDISDDDLPLGDFQTKMDEGSSIAGSQFQGMPKQTEFEVQPMAAEELLRRRAGIPQHGRPQYNDPRRGYGDKPLSEDSPQRVTLDSERHYGKRFKDKDGKPYDRVGMGSNLSSKNKQKMRDIDEGIKTFHPHEGWKQSSSPDALINLRNQGRKEEAVQRAKQKFGKSEEDKPSEIQYTPRQWYNKSWKDKKTHIRQKMRDEKSPRPSIDDAIKNAVSSVLSSNKAKINKSEGIGEDSPKPKSPIHKMMSGIKNKFIKK